jgi:hypothetical protein
VKQMLVILWKVKQMLVILWKVKQMLVISDLLTPLVPLQKLQRANNVTASSDCSTHSQQLPGFIRDIQFFNFAIFFLTTPENTCKSRRMSQPHDWVSSSYSMQQNAICRQFVTQWAQWHAVSGLRNSWKTFNIFFTYWVFY